MQGITEEYIAGQEAINSMRDASDYLTEKSRTFVVSGSLHALRLYCEEVEEVKRRDQSLETLRKIAREKGEDKLISQLQIALNESNRLAEVELYAMRLSAEGHGIDPEQIKRYLAGVELNREDLALSDADQIDRAEAMVFGDDYDEVKSNILKGVAGSLEDLTEKTKAEQADSYRRTARYTRILNVLAVIMLLSIFAMMIMTSALIIRPIRKSVDYLGSNEELPVKGSAEYAFLADTYNRILDKAKKQNEELSYEATHDEVTGLYNRKQFESKREQFADDDIAMLLVDIDYFKEVNDTYGHQTGDQVLMAVGGILRDSFRLEDYVCRIGGDEFAILMVSMKPDLEYVVRDKITRLRARLAEAADIPTVTVSIGAAFSREKGEEEDLFRRADLALYHTKEKGRNGYTFYSEINGAENHN